MVSPMPSGQGGLNPNDICCAVSTLPMSDQTTLKRISARELVGEELAEWYAMTPMERWRESAKLWEVFLWLGGSLDPERDTQSPFFDAESQSSRLG